MVIEWEEFLERERMYEPVPRHEMSAEGRTLYDKVESESKGVYGLVDMRTAEHGRRMRKLEKGQVTLGAKVDKLEKGQVTLGAKVDKLEKGQVTLGAKVDKLEAKVDTLVETVQRIDARLGGPDAS